MKKIKKHKDGTFEIYENGKLLVFNDKSMNKKDANDLLKKAIKILENK